MKPSLGLPPADGAGMARRHFLKLAAALPAAVGAGCSRRDKFPAYDNTSEVEEYYRNTPNKPGYFVFAKPEDLPADLAWQDGMDLPELGSDEAKKGGMLRWFAAQFPPTLRHFGPDANSSFRSEHHDDFMLGPIGLHPNEQGKYVPGVCNQWAVSADRSIVYLKIDPAARFSNGRPVTTKDFLITPYLYASQYAQFSFGQNFFMGGKYYAGITVYDDMTFAIRMAGPKADPLYWTASWLPHDHIFYREFGPDFVQRYQWRKNPTTGAYDIAQEDVHQNERITLRRIVNWWAKDRKYYRNRYNPDAIEYRFYHNPDKAFEAFKAGKLDFFHTYVDLNPNYWYEKADVDEVFNGWICKAQFYNEYPRASVGVYMNCAKPLLDDVRIRRGLQHALNWQKVNEIEMKGDLERLRTTQDGYGKFTHPTMQPADFSPEKAAAHFAEAGFTEKRDGIWTNPSTGKQTKFKLTCRQRPSTLALILRLKEEAIKAGVLIEPDPRDDNDYFKKTREKNHELAYLGWVNIPPYPDYFQGYHSSEAYEKQPDGSRKVKVQTNNVSSVANEELDKLIEAHEKAATLEELATLGHQIEEIIAKEACFSGGVINPWYRCLYWRWVRWPGEFNVMISENPQQQWVCWIDPDLYRETMDARITGRVMDEKDEIFDSFQKKA